LDRREVYGETAAPIEIKLAGAHLGWTVRC
jgi:hypothetical protein